MNQSRNPHYKSGGQSHGRDHGASQGRDRRSGGGFSGRAPARPAGGNFHQKSFQKFDAVCSKCGKACQVPFRPNAGRPIFCADCFGAPHDKNIQKFEPRAEAPSTTVNKKTITDFERQFNAMNAKVDTMLRLLETMSNQAARATEPTMDIIAPEPAPKTRTPQKRIVRAKSSSHAKRN